MTGDSAALDAIREAFGEPVDYRPSEDAPLVPGLQVIWSDVAGDAFQGAGSTTRMVTAEIEQNDIALRPTGNARITRNGKAWKVIEVVDRDDVAAWVVTLQQVS